MLSAIAFAEAAAPKDHGENRSIMDLARAFFCAPAENRQIEPGITITIAAVVQRKPTLSPMDRAVVLVRR